MKKICIALSAAAFSLALSSASFAAKPSPSAAGPRVTRGAIADRKAAGPRITRGAIADRKALDVRSRNQAKTKLNLNTGF